MTNLGPDARSLISAKHWLRGIESYKFLWQVTLVSANHASSILGQVLALLPINMQSVMFSLLSMKKVWTQV